MNNVNRLQFDPEQFRRDFKLLDDSAFLSVGHVAALMHCSVAGIYSMRARGLLPEAAIQRHKTVLWTAGQWRAWVALCASAAAASGNEPGEHGPRARRGRRRAATGVLTAQTQQ